MDLPTNVGRRLSSEVGRLATHYRDLPIKHKLRLILICTLGTALLLAFAADAAYREIEQRAEMRSGLDVLAGVFASTSTAALSFADRRAATELFQGLRATRHVQTAFLYAEDGEVFTSYRRDAGTANPAPPPRPDGAWFEKNKLIVYKNIVLNGQRIGTVYLESDLGGLRATRVRLAGIMLLILLIATALAVALFSRLQRVISEPIAHLAQIAKTVSGQKDYSVRGVKRAGDELGRLTDTLNEMLSEIESNRASLERQVAGRTAELVAALNQAEEARGALVISEERFRIAAENASDMILECDLRTGRISTFGWLADRFGGHPAPASFAEWKQRIHPDDVGPLLQDIQQHVQSGKPHRGDYRVLGTDDRIYHYSSRGQAIRNADGKPYKVVGLLTDITDSKLAEEAVSRLAAIVQCSEDAIIGASPSGSITSWNGGAEKLLGYRAPEVLGASISMLLASANLAREIFDPSARGGVSRLDEITFVAKDGSEVPVSLTVSPIRNAGGELTGVATIAHDIRARKQAEGELAHQAQHDHLTGLPNRLLLADRLAASIARAERNGCMTAVIYIDLDGFKFVNDSLGHEIGDALLQQVTGRLRRCIREPDTLARMGGDEFMLVMNEIPDDKVALSIAERLRSALGKPFSVAGHELYMTASMGISMYPRDGADVSTLRRNADAAMYEAKHKGKDRIHFFTPVLRASFQQRLELETELRRSLDRNEFTLFYQPIFEAVGGRQTAFEALLRWFHPKLGVIPPSRFIPVAEETGLIVRLGAWVMQEASRKCRVWQRNGMESVRVAVNVSALEFAKPDFVESVLGVLNATGLSGDLLELELTETVLMRDRDDSIRKMSKLRARGVRVSIDDFGTGYSSLGYLPGLPIDALKIDRSFVAELGSNSNALSLIEGMISLAHSIGKRVVVEGVETHEQLDILREVGSDEIQGFLLGRPAKLPDWDEAPGAGELFEVEAEAPLSPA